VQVNTNYLNTSNGYLDSMLDLVFWIVIFIISLAVLIKASDLFTDSTEKIGVALGLPTFIIGVTIVAFGTSLPEFISAIFSFAGNVPEIVVGNVIGANIANIFLILGLSAIIGKNIKISRNMLSVDLPMMIAAALLFVFVVFDGKIVLIETLLLCGMFVVYLLYITREERPTDEKEIKKEIRGLLKIKEIKKRTWAILVFSGVLIYFSARFTVESVIAFSEIFNVGKEVIAATIFSIGTTLPELTVSVVAASKGKPEIAIGNILGSNIFNALAVLGIPALLGMIILSVDVFTFNVNIFMLAVLIAATVLYFFITQDRETTSWEGWLLIIFYIFFILTILGVIV